MLIHWRKKALNQASNCKSNETGANVDKSSCGKRKRTGGGYCEERPSGSYYIWFILQKRNLEQFAASRRIAQALGVSVSNVSFAGIKDKRAVTTQWASVAIHPQHRRQSVSQDVDSDEDNETGPPPGTTDPTPLSVEITDAASTTSPPSLQEVLEALQPFHCTDSTDSRHTDPHSHLAVSNVHVRDRPIGSGELKGNRFRITLRQLQCGSGPHPSSASSPHSLLVERLEKVKARGFPNFYGSQRMGIAVSLPSSPPTVDGSTSRTVLASSPSHTTVSSQDTCRSSHSLSVAMRDTVTATETVPQKDEVPKLVEEGVGDALFDLPLGPYLGRQLLSRRFRLVIDRLIVGDGCCPVVREAYRNTHVALCNGGGIAGGDGGEGKVVGRGGGGGRDDVLQSEGWRATPRESCGHGMCLARQLYLLAPDLDTQTIRESQSLVGMNLFMSGSRLMISIWAMDMDICIYIVYIYISLTDWLTGWVKFSIMPWSID